MKNTTPRRSLSFFTNNSDIQQRVPGSHLSLNQNELGVWLLEDGSTFGPYLRVIPSDYDFVSNFQPGQSVLYFMPSAKGISEANRARDRVRKVSVVLASGENALFSEIQRTANILDVTVNVKNEPLHAGDVVFFIDKEDGSRQRLEIVIERKSPSDFLSSIKDHRLKEQKAMMLSTFNTPAAIIYFIEGNPLETPSGIHPNARIGALVKPMAVDGTSAVLGNGIETTARFIVNMHMYLERIPEEELTRKKLLLAHTPNAGIKKSDITENNKIIHQLQAVPGVGEVMAESIAAEVKSFDEMEEKYRMFGKYALADVRVLGGKKDRNVGKAISEKIYKYYNFDKHKDGAEMMHKKRKIIEDEDDEEDEIED